MHSFNSAATTLKVLREMGIWSVDEDQMCDLEQVIRLLGESVQPLPAIWREDFKHGRPMVTTMQSHHNLQEIFYYLWEKRLTPRDSLADQIFRVVLFHHSIEAMEAHPNMVNLSSLEKSKWCDDQFFKVCQVLQIADNESYILFDETHVQRCRREILKRQDGNVFMGAQRDKHDTQADSGD